MIENRDLQTSLRSNCVGAGFKFCWIGLLVLVCSGTNPRFIQGESVVIRRVDGSSEQVSLLEFDSSHISYRAASLDSINALPLDELKSVTWDRTLETEPHPGILVETTHNDLYFVNAISTRDDFLLCDLGGQEFSVPIEYVREITFQTTPAAERASALLSGSEDVLLLENGDVVKGELAAIEREQVSIATSLGQLTLQMSGLRSIQLNPELAATPVAAHPMLRCYHKNGSIFSTKTLTWEPEKSRCQILVQEKSKIQILFQDLCRIDLWTNQQVMLSNEQPVHFSSESYLGRNHTYRRNRTFDGSLLTAEGQLYDFGFGLSGKSRIEFAIPAGAVTFQTALGFDGQSQYGSVDASISVDGEVRWHQLLTRRVHPFLRLPGIDVTDAEKIELIIEFGDQADVGDQVSWYQPYFMRQ